MMVDILEVRENGPPKMPPQTALGRILVPWRFCLPTNWWVSWEKMITGSEKHDFNIPRDHHFLLAANHTNVLILAHVWVTISL